jgi:hypothetical protein
MLSATAAIAASRRGAVDLEMTLPCLSLRESPTHRGSLHGDSKFGDPRIGAFRTPANFEPPEFSLFASAVGLTF